MDAVAVDLGSAAGGAVAGLAGGLAGGVIGGFVGRSLLPAAVPRQAAPRGLAAAAWGVAILGLALPMRPTVGDTRADLVIGPERNGRADVTVTLDPPDAAEDARWFHVLAWQGAKHGDGGLELSRLRRTGPGRYVTEDPVPISGTWKTLVRLHTGSAMSAAPIYLPADPAIPADEVRATEGSHALVREKAILQREATGGTPALERGAYAVLALIGATWLLCMGWGLRRLDADDSPSAERERRVAAGRISPVAPT